MITTSMCKTNLQEMNFSLIKFEIIAFNSNDHFISNITIKEKYFFDKYISRSTQTIMQIYLTAKHNHCISPLNS